jgi:oxygen-independent coproporphyrinogen-3 oxidase
MGTHPDGREKIEALLRRYDRPGPRYTSYPTAAEFDTDVDAGTYEERLRLANGGTGPLSFYLHLPFCNHRCLFCGCNVIITPHQEKARPYLDLLRSEIELIAARLPERRDFSQLHLGGGTPTYFEPAELSGLLQVLLDDFQPTDDAELAIEVDPRVTTEEHVDALASHGFNRISLGVQDFTPDVQQAIERVQSVDETRTIIEAARTRDFRGINVDLIYGLPLQTPETFERTVEEVIGLAPDRVAVYSFAYVPDGRGHQTRIDLETLPSPDTKLSLLALARERFLSAGYEPIGIDHFARPEDELAVARREGRLRRNFQGYTVIPASEVLCMGISAIGDVNGAYVQNEKKLSTYRTAIGEGRLPTARGIARNPDDEIRRRVIHDLMCNFSVDVTAVERELDIDFADYFRVELQRAAKLADEGLVELSDSRLRATPVGELFARNIAMCFDRYWWERHEGSDHVTFSRTV